MKLSSPLIRAVELQKGLNDEARLTISVEPGTITCVIGPDSEGISCWLRIMAGLEFFVDGRLELLGRDWREMDRESWQQSRQKIGYISADSALHSVQNIMDNIITPAYYHKLGTWEHLKEKAQGLLKQAGYTDQASLSLLPAYVAPEKRYLAMLVRALMLEPQVLFFDNLFGKIGVMAKNDVYKLLMERVRQSGMSIVFNTRNLDFVSQYADALLFVCCSKVLKFDDFQQFQNSDDSAVTEYKKQYAMR
ncbi:MAG: ATP-binding cassette domain-containing protein [Proteobacteria bacterium]|nr:ATP-binding cassette domain-containing protein [Pseudomonadota bacterium]MBU1714698.1 ATP-binding cassette domain-containing protein [Pseudomonadota bacterium]